MLAIKLKRIGKKHQPTYRLVVMEKKSKMSGRFIEDLGFYNPHSKDARIDKERVDYWMKNGAQPTISAGNLLIKKKVTEGDKVKAHSTRRRKKMIEREEAAKAEAFKKQEEEAIEEEEKENKEIEEMISEEGQQKEELKEEIEEEKKEETREEKA